MLGSAGGKKLYHNPIVDDKKIIKEEDNKPDNNINNNNFTSIYNSSSSNNISNNNNDREKASVSAIRGGVIRNGVYFSESELAEQGNITWTPCYWTRERISKWVEEVENPDTLKTIAKALPPSAPSSSS